MTHIESSRTLSKIYVEAHEDSKSTLCAQLDRLGAPYERTNSQPVDILWSVDGQPVMLDLKTPEDMIASAMDGRLHHQCLAMERASCLIHGFLIEGTASRDGITVGHASHAWDYNRYDNLLLSLQVEGNVIITSTSPSRTASRLLAMYRWTGREDHASWRRPVKPTHASQRWYGDDDYRAHIEMLMALPGMGPDRAEDLLGEFAFAAILDPHQCEALMSVRGIGKGLASKWKTFLEADYTVPWT